jgi:hypothetical protein
VRRRVSEANRTTRSKKEKRKNRTATKHMQHVRSHRCSVLPDEQSMKLTSSAVKLYSLGRHGGGPTTGPTPPSFSTYSGWGPALVVATSIALTFFFQLVPQLRSLAQSSAQWSAAVECVCCALSLPTACAHFESKAHSHFIRKTTISVN